MLNKSGIIRTTYGNVHQILANVGLQSSVGCIVPAALGVVVGTRKIAKAGTPIKIDLMSLQTPAVAGTDEVAMNAVLLHDVDVTGGSANGTALIFGFVNVNRVEADVAALITTALTAAAVSQKITFIKA